MNQLEDRWQRLNLTEEEDNEVKIDEERVFEGNKRGDQSIGKVVDRTCS